MGWWAGGGWWGRPHHLLLVAKRLQSALLARVHGDAAAEGEHHAVSVGTGECRVPRAGLALRLMGLSCSWLGFPVWLADLGASGLMAIGSEGNEAKEWPTFGCWCLGGQGAAALGCTGARGAPRLSGGISLWFCYTLGTWSLCRGGWRAAPGLLPAEMPPLPMAQRDIPVASTVRSLSPLGELLALGGISGGCWHLPRPLPLHGGPVGRAATLYEP